MKNLIVSSSLILLGTFALFSSAHADCPDATTITNPTVLIGTTVCVVNESQEFHSGISGEADNLIDYKKGAIDPVDPTTSVGSWSISGDNITYTYGSNIFTYTVHQAVGDVEPSSYCNVATNAEFFIDQIISGSATPSQCNWAAPAL